MVGTNGLRLKHPDDMSENERHAVTRIGHPSETFEPEEQEAFTVALQVLNEAGLPYLVSGALATHHYTGIWRDSKDLDLFISRADLDAAMDILSRNGFDDQFMQRCCLARLYGTQRAAPV